MAVNDFTDDKEKMRDFAELTKDEFLRSYSYLTEEEYDATQIIRLSNLLCECVNYIEEVINDSEESNRVLSRLGMTEKERIMLGVTPSTSQDAKEK